MKAVSLSLALLLLLLLGTVWNHIYINKVATTLESMLRELPEMQDPSCSAEVEELLAYWEEQSVTVGLSVPYFYFAELCGAHQITFLQPL